MARDKASIYIELQSLYRDLYTFQLEMCKCDRIALGNKMLEHCEQAIAYFSLAYEVESQRVRYIEMLCAEFEVLKIECRFAIDRFYKKESTKSMEANDGYKHNDYIKFKFYGREHYYQRGQPPHQ